MALFLREAEIEKLVTMRMALDAVEEAFRLHGGSNADNAPRRRCRFDKGFLHVMSASLPTQGLAGLKSYTTVAGNQTLDKTTLNARRSARPRRAGLPRSTWLGRTRGVWESSAQATRRAPRSKRFVPCARYRRSLSTGEMLRGGKDSAVK